MSFHPSALPSPRASGFSWRRFLAVAGPGIAVTLADTDVGSVATAAQSGAHWGYRLLLLRFVLMPILYLVQELTVRLGAVTGEGHAALIKRHFGRAWAWVSVARWAHPGAGEIAGQVLATPVGDPKCLLPVSANIGAVIMPWMVFYQQSAVEKKGLTAADLPAARADTAIGSVVTQLIMAAVLVAAALSRGSSDVSLDTVSEISSGLTPVLGEAAGRLVFGLGVAGAAIVAAIVVTLTAARTLDEILGFQHSTGRCARRAGSPSFTRAFSSQGRPSSSAASTS